MMPTPTATDFQEVLSQMFQEAQNKGLSYIDIRAGELHRQVGGYPGSNYRMPLCCNVMRQMMMPSDEVLEEPPSGLGANLRIRYKLPRKSRSENSTIQHSDKITMEKFKMLPKENTCVRFEALARKILSEHYGASLTKGKAFDVPKEFDMISSNGKIVGDAKYFTMVQGRFIPPAKFSVIAEYVWLLEKTPAIHKFLVFGNDRKVPREWLKRYGHMVKDVDFFFLSEQTRKLEKLN